jgi:hypothetical protein
MFTFRCTQVLRKKLALPVNPEPPAPTTRLGDWYGNVLNVGHQRLTIFISERSLLPVIMPLKERHQILHNFKQRLADVLVHLDIDAHLISGELNQMQEVIIAPTANRSVLGSMNDFIATIKYCYYDIQHWSLTAIALWLADTPCSPIKYESPDRLTPRLLSGEGL